MPKYSWEIAESGFKLPETVGSGERNNMMHRYLSSLRGKGATNDQVEDAAFTTNKTNFDPPIDERELLSIIRSVCRYNVGDGTYHGNAEPAVIESDNIPTIDRVVPMSVLPDLSDMSPVEQAKAYIRACFEDEDTVCLSRNLMSINDDIYEYAGTLLGGCGYEAFERFLPHVEDVGMWNCVNPLLPDDPVKKTGYRRNKDSVAAYRNILVECDALPMEKQLELMLKLFWNKDGLLRAIVDSGGKSYHCIIRARSTEKIATSESRYGEPEYRVDVKFLYDLCDHNGLIVDRQCGNPTRMTRTPGAMRKKTGRMQRLVWAYGI